MEENPELVLLEQGMAGTVEVEQINHVLELPMATCMNRLTLVVVVVVMAVG